tara:strand:+ start:187 stop:573 length:387 start_codon:yes stop_codon:yes gene_type:complete
MSQHVKIQLIQDELTLTREVTARRKNMDTLTCLKAACNLVCKSIDNLQEHHQRAKANGVKLSAALKWTKPCTIKVTVDDVVQFHSEELLTSAGFKYIFRPQTFKKLRIHLEAAFEQVEVWSNSKIDYK